MLHTKGDLYSHFVFLDCVSVSIDACSNIVYLQSSNVFNGLFCLIKSLYCFCPSFIRTSNKFYYFCYMSHDILHILSDI